MYELFEHTADLGLRVRAVTLAELFADAARGLFAMVVADEKSIQPRETISLVIEGPPTELLLFDWLNELLFIYETRHLLLVDFDVDVTETGLTATARGEPADPERHLLEHEVKAITYHGLLLEFKDGQWLAEVIVDI